MQHISTADCRGFLVRTKYNPVLELRRKTTKMSRNDSRADKRMQEIHRKELESFCVDVLTLNQENEKNQRLFMDGIASNGIMDAPDDYVRPEGFKIIPKMLTQLGSQVTNRLTIHVLRLVSIFNLFSKKKGSFDFINNRGLGPAPVAQRQ